VGVDSEGRTDTVPVRLLRREPADDEGWVLLQLRCIKESAVVIAALIAGSRPFTILRVLGQPDSDGLFARVTTPPPLPGPAEIRRPKEPWPEEPWPEDPFAGDAPAGKVKPTRLAPERAGPKPDAPRGDKPAAGPPNGPAPDDTPPHGTARVEVSPKWTSA
jgi:hypothetical protein